MARNFRNRSNAVLALALLLSGCTSAASAPEGKAPAGSAKAGESKAAAQGNAAFGLDLYKRLSEEPGNVFISPISIAGAFGPVAAGAQGETRATIERALRFPATGEALHSQLGGMLRGLERSSDGVTLSIADALWVKEGFPLKPTFKATAGKHYDATAEALDFARAPEASAERINKWVSEETRGRIRELFGRDSFNHLTALVVTNAVYFLGDWAEQFPASATQDQPFHSAGGTVQVPLMTMQRRFHHFETESFQAVDLPYKDPRLSMTVFLPKERGELAAFERELDKTKLREWLGSVDGAEKRDVQLFLPKLKIDESYKLVPPLREMGMGVAFEAGKADFRGIADADLFISDVVHKTFLKIDEKGTEAAAATGVTITLTSAPPPPVLFRADHPFFFVIRDKGNGAILFLGRIENPAGDGAS